MVISDARNFHSRHLLTLYRALPTPRVFILFLSGTLLFGTAILSGCSGYTRAKSNSATSTNGATPPPSGALSQPALSFGNVSVGSTSNQSLTITNSETSP